MMGRLTLKRLILAAAMLAGGAGAYLVRPAPAAGPAAGAAGAAGAAKVPPAVARPVDFVKDVAPIFESACMQCHANGTFKADLSIESRDKLLEGGGSSPAIVVGDGAGSLLVQLVSGVDPERIMPEKGKRLTDEQIGVLRAWIDRGAAWPKDYVLLDANKPRPAKLAPRKVGLPPVVDGQGNPVDRLLRAYFEQKKVAPPNHVADDRTFARRVYLDLIGLLPSPAELAAFVADADPAKRTALVRKLLGDDERYAAHWMSFWNDLLRNDYKGTGYIDGGRTQVTRWLHASLKRNKPYDQFVRELVTAAPGAEGFTKGIVWRGVVNSAQTPQMQAAQGISQVFMGVNLKCASCHDSFINQWKLTDSYGLAGVFADKALEMERCDKPLGTTAPFKFLYPELGEIDAAAPRAQRVRQLAQAITHERNGRLTRTIVNRLWQRLMGRGLIEPVDEMDAPPWSADVLDWLAQDLVEQKYDLKKTLETIALSRAYQLPAAALADEAAKGYVFAGPGFKRMTAEQFADCVAQILDVWPEKMEAKLADPAKDAPVAGGRQVRAAFLAADPLTTALGRPNRDQINTARPSSSTTLMALELTNGATLDDVLKRGAKKLSAEKDVRAEDLIARVYQQALGRAATAAEAAAAKELVGADVSGEGVEDFLWAIVMLPEFQIIR